MAKTTNTSLTTKATSGSKRTFNRALTRNQVVSIRNPKNTKTQGELATAYGVSRKTIYNVKTGITYRDWQ